MSVNIELLKMLAVKLLLKHSKGSFNFRKVRITYR